MKQTPHPADVADQSKITEAIEFTAHLRRNAFDKITERFPTLAEASRRAAEFEGTSSRQALVYAIHPDGSSIFVPRDMRDAALSATPRIKAKETAAMATKPLSGTEISKLTAIVTGGPYKRSNSWHNAKMRFLKIASEAGIKAPEAFLEMPFKAAADELRAELDAIRSGGKPKAQKPANVNAPKQASKPVAADRKPTGKRAAILEAAQRGELPAPPDFSAPSHARYRKKLAELVAMVEAGDVEGLRSLNIPTYSSSPQAMNRYRNLAIIALEARSK